MRAAAKRIFQLDIFLVQQKYIFKPLERSFGMHGGGIKGEQQKIRMFTRIIIHWFVDRLEIRAFAYRNDLIVLIIIVGGMAKGKRSKQSGASLNESVQLPGRSEIMEDMVRRLGEVLWKQMCLPAGLNVLASVVIG